MGKVDACITTYWYKIKSMPIKKVLFLIVMESFRMLHRFLSQVIDEVDVSLK